ncbi:hypothetical protein VIM7927_00462 [Vibrio mangrovi]|uniref:Uncharacterized protein n=1 Tax=Vibrio mangrovi TaxID=474394 RepID=A0A1Y6INL2_9VIBR|nr:hypothetical protein VIM7927_00462 [Vibrio mangrovi]
MRFICGGLLFGVVVWCAMGLLDLFGIDTSAPDTFGLAQKGLKFRVRWPGRFLWAVPCPEKPQKSS